MPNPMGCCGKQFGEFFQQGFGKLWLIVVVLFVACFAVYFSMTIAFPKTFPPDTYIPFQLDNDLFIKENYTGYKGYIRFEQEMINSPGSESRYLTVKIVLELPKDVESKYDVKLEILGKDNSFIRGLILKQSTFVPVKSGYSYNKSTIDLDKNRVGDIKYFRYSFKMH